MNPTVLIAIAAAAWWFYKRQQQAAGPPQPQIEASASVFTHRGRSYRVVGQPTGEGLVPVQYVPPAGTWGTQVIQWFDPVSGTIVSGGGTQL
jgi:hypothetical protein